MNEMFWDQDPNLPDEVNDTIDLLLLVFSWPPIYRTEVRMTVAGWEPHEVEKVSEWAAAMHARANDHDNPVVYEPTILFDLRRRCAVVNNRELPTRYEEMREQERERP